MTSPRSEQTRFESRMRNHERGEDVRHVLNNVEHEGNDEVSETILGKSADNALFKIATWTMRGRGITLRTLKRMVRKDFVAVLSCNVRIPDVSPGPHVVSRTSFSKKQINLVHDGRVAIATKHPIEAWGVSANRRTLHADIGLGGQKLRLVTTLMPLIPSEETEETFQDVTCIVKNTPTTHELVIAGHFNATPIFRGYTMDDHVRPSQIGDPHALSTRLLRLLLEADLCIPDTFLRQPWRRRWTYRNPNTGECNQIDHFLCRRSVRQMFNRISTRTDVEGDSDHRLICAKIRWPVKSRNAPKIHDDARKSPHNFVSTKKIMEGYPCAFPEGFRTDPTKTVVCRYLRI